MQQAAKSWIAAGVSSVLSVFLVPLVFLILGNYFIPQIIEESIEESNKTEALRKARLKESVDVGLHDEDLTTKLHRLKTTMQTFNNQSVRRKLLPSQLRQRQSVFQQDYTERYLAFDEIAWLWMWDLKRDAEIFDLLSPDETKKLEVLIPKYKDNIAQSVGAIDPLWNYLSSSEYSLSDESQNRIKTIEAKMNSDLNTLHDARVLFVKDIAMLFAQSKYEPKR